MRLALRFVVRLEDALCLCLVVRFEARLLAADFVLQVEYTPGTPDQTECLFHCFTHGYECVRLGVPRVSEQWTGYGRAVTGF